MLLSSDPPSSFPLLRFCRHRHCPDRLRTLFHVAGNEESGRNSGGVACNGLSDDWGLVVSGSGWKERTGAFAADA